MNARNWIGLVGALTLGIAGVGCGGSIAGLCEEMCDCEGCSDEELDECIDELEDMEHAAEREGCEDQFDTALSCFSDEAECHGDDFDADGCEPELEDLDDCVDDRTVGDDSTGPADPP